MEGSWRVAGKSYGWRDVSGGLERVIDRGRDLYVKEGILGGELRGEMARGGGERGGGMRDLQGLRI
jgi:hypothetical protein